MRASSCTAAEWPAYTSTDRHGGRDNAAPARISPPALNHSVTTSRRRGRLCSTQRITSAAPKTKTPATPAISALAVSIATGDQGPGVHGRAAESVGRRRGGHHASSANSGSSAKPAARPARYNELGAKVSVMVPDVPAGTTHPCCHPLTTNGVNRVPALVRATQPVLILSGTTSTRAVAAPGTRTSRRAGPHAPVAAGVAAAAADWAASDPDNSAPSTTNCGPGLTNSSCWPVGNAIGSASQGCAVTGAPSSSAPTVVCTEVCTKRPAIAMTGPFSQSTVTSRLRLRAALAAAIGLPSVPSPAISASPGGLS